MAICDELPDENISIVGQYAGRLATTSGKGERICREETEKNVEKISFITSEQNVVVDWSCRPYVSGFSGNGNYFVHATDGGVVILKRKPGKIDLEKYRQEIEQEIFQRGYEKVICQVFPQYGLREWAVIIEVNESGDGFNVFMTMDRASVAGKQEIRSKQNS